VRIEVADSFSIWRFVYMKLNGATNWETGIPAVTRTQGRLKPRNLLVTGLSPCWVNFSVHVFRTQLPSPVVGVKEGYNPFVLALVMDTCLVDNQGNFVINWQMWWLDLFTWLSLIGIFALLVAGTYLLISDLAHEERQDTLNFIRLSPSHQQAFWSANYWEFPFCSISWQAWLPLHCGLGWLPIPLSLILSFYGVLIASCLFFQCRTAVWLSCLGWAGSSLVGQWHSFNSSGSLLSNR